MVKQKTAMNELPMTPAKKLVATEAAVQIVAVDKPNSVTCLAAKEKGLFDLIQ